MDIQTQYDTNLIFEHMPIGVALFDTRNFLLLHANPMYLSSLDTAWQNGRALEQPISDWLPKAEENGILAIFSNVVFTGIPYRANEYAFPSFERGMTYWNWTIDPLRDESGRVAQLLVTTYEITAQVLARQQTERMQTSLEITNKRVEAERKRLAVVETVARSVQQLFDPQQVSDAAIAAIRANFDTQFVYTYVATPEQHVLHLLSMQPEISDEKIFKFLQHIPWDSKLPAAQAYRQRTPVVIENMQNALSTGAIEQSTFLANSIIQGYICVPLWFGEHFEGVLGATFNHPIAPNGPEVQTLLGCSIHIAAALTHTRMHSAIEHERTRLRAILDQLPEGILITESSNGSISYINDAAAHIFGIPTQQLIGSPLHRLPYVYQVQKINGHPIQPWNFIIIRALIGETITSQDTIITRTDGSRTFILSSAAPLRTEAGVISGAVIVFQDITAKKSIEQQKNEFLSIASHERRTPITAIQGFAEILQFQMVGKSDLDPQSTRALAVISEQSERLSQLIEEMLDISRIENVQLLLTRSPHDIISILQHVIETQASTSKNHSIKLVLEGLTEDDTLIANIDENRIVQVLSNLINNAIKYSPRGGTIEVGLRYNSVEPNQSDAANECLIWVKDAGIGIPAADLPLIFKRFHRSSHVDSSISGLGIGLYLVKELITRHGGHVWAESTEGIGSTFYVKLPLGTV
ncbi:MAG TPA: ATP-binding protein [Ktedonobacteraceae bacterium]|nr:ATP-binding protein [Ktedonobacteraceae bacterium]